MTATADMHGSERLRLSRGLLRRLRSRSHRASVRRRLIQTVKRFLASPVNEAS